MFSCFFATYAVLQGATAGGPTARQIVEPSRVAMETAALLLVQLHLRPVLRRHQRAQPAVDPGLPGDHRPARPGLPRPRAAGVHRPGRSAARRRSAAPSSPPSSPWSAATACTSPWACCGSATMMAQLQVKGFRREIIHRLVCFNLFWHALDIIWVGAVLGRLSDGSAAVSEADPDVARRRVRLRRPRARRRAGARAPAIGCATTSSASASRPSSPSPRFCAAAVAPDLGPGGGGGADRAGHRPDGRAPGLLPPHHHRARQHQQRPGAGLRRAGGVPDGRRLDLDHGQPQRQHDADDAARCSRCSGKIRSAGILPAMALRTGSPRSRVPPCWTKSAHSSIGRQAAGSQLAHQLQHPPGMLLAADEEVGEVDVRLIVDQRRAVDAGGVQAGRRARRRPARRSPTRTGRRCEDRCRPRRAGCSSPWPRPNPCRRVRRPGARRRRPPRRPVACG